MSMFTNLSVIKQCENTTYKLADELFFFVPLIYGIPTLFLHISITSIIYIKRHDPVLKLSFYRIYAVYSIMMVVMWCLDMISTRFIAIGYFCRELLYLWGEPSYSLSPVQFLMTYSRHAQFYAATVLSINRMTAVVFPTQYNNIWESQWITFLTLMFVLPLFTSWYLLPTQSKLIPYTLGGLTIKYHKIMRNALCSVTFTTTLVASICALIIFCATIIIYYKLASFRGNLHQWSKVDKNLLAVGMTSSVSTFLLAFAEVPLYVSINYGNLPRKYFFIGIFVKQIVIDLTFIFSAWSIIFLCSSVKSSIFGLYSTMKRGKSMVTELTIYSKNKTTNKENITKCKKKIYSGDHLPHTRSPSPELIHGST